jgi:hypothetical protein
MDAARSTFVTVLAWIFIVLSGMTTFISIMQNLMIAMLFAPEALAGIKPPRGDEDIAPFVHFLFGNIRLFFIAFLIVSTLMLAASIGLLMRRNWGRILFVALMILGIVWNIVGFALMFMFFGAFVNAPAGPGAESFRSFAYVMVGFNVLLGLGFIALMGWIVKRLLSPEIRREFVPG